MPPSACPFPSMFSAENLAYTDNTFECILGFVLIENWHDPACFSSSRLLFLSFVLFLRGWGRDRLHAFMGQHFKSLPKLQVGPVCSSAPSYLRQIPVSHFYLWPFLCLKCVCVRVWCHLKFFEEIFGFHCIKILSLLALFSLKNIPGAL